MGESWEDAGSLSELVGFLRYGKAFQRGWLDDPGYSQILLEDLGEDLIHLGKEYPEDSRRLGVLRQKLLHSEVPELTPWEEAYIGEVLGGLLELGWDPKVSCLQYFRDDV